MFNSFCKRLGHVANAILWLGATAAVVAVAAAMTASTAGIAVPIAAPLALAMLRETIPQIFKSLGQAVGRDLGQLDKFRGEASIEADFTAPRMGRR